MTLLTAELGSSVTPCSTRHILDLICLECSLKKNKKKKHWKYCDIVISISDLCVFLFVKTEHIKSRVQQVQLLLNIAEVQTEQIGNKGLQFAHDHKNWNHGSILLISCLWPYDSKHPLSFLICRSSSSFKCHSLKCHLCMIFWWLLTAE